MANKIIIWGAGKIGRGFVGEIFFNAGYELVFVDAAESLIKQLNDQGQYTVLKYRNADTKLKTVVKNYTAIHSSDKAKIAEEAAECSLMALAIFPGIFEEVANNIAEIIQKRIDGKITQPLDIIMCANISGPSKMMETMLLGVLNDEQKKYYEKYVGLIDSLVIRMAVQPTEEMIKDDSLVILTNGYETLTLDKLGFKGDLVEVDGIAYTENIHAEEVRKMYTYNMVHALYSYLGFQKGYEYVEACTRDAEIQKNAIGALDEVGEALSIVFGFEKDDMDKWKHDVLENMANPILMDKVARVGADPIRKLKKNDRLTGPALLCKNNGVYPYYLTKAIAHAFLFGDETDKNAAIVREYAEYYGIKKAAEKYCQLDGEPEVIGMIEAHYKRALEKKTEPDKKIEWMKKAYGLGFKAEKVYKGCAQCLLIAMFELTSKTNEMLFQSASGFSGGMAITGDGVCGGYAGGVMFMGTYAGRRFNEMKIDGDKVAQYESYTMAQELRDFYIQTYGTVTCCDIHKAVFGRCYCLRTKAVRDEFEEAGAHTNKCTSVVGMASVWTTDVMYEHGYIK